MRGDAGAPKRGPGGAAGRRASPRTGARRPRPWPPTRRRPRRRRRRRPRDPCTGRRAAPWSPPGARLPAPAPTRCVAARTMLTYDACETYPEPKAVPALALAALEGGPDSPPTEWQAPSPPPVSSASPPARLQPRRSEAVRPCCSAIERPCCAAGLSAGPERWADVAAVKGGAPPPRTAKVSRVC
jgi:hypothetical protein